MLPMLVQPGPGGQCAVGATEEPQRLWPELAASTWHALLRAAASVRAQQGEPGALPARLASALAGRRAQEPYVTTARRFCFTHPLLSEQVENVLADQDWERLEDIAWAPVLLPSVRRLLFIPAVSQELEARAEQLRTAIDASPEAACWDNLIIGGGMTGAALAATLSQAQPRGRTLVIEARLGSASFLEAGAAFFANTWSTGRSGPALPSTGADLNPTLGPAVSQLSGALYPTGETLAHSSLLALYRSGVDVLLRTRVTQLEEQASGQLVLTLRGPGGVLQRVRARSVFVATGLGERRINLHDPLSCSLVARELERVDAGEPAVLAEPLVLAADQVLALAARAVDPLLPFKTEGTLCIAGGGSSACTLLELLRRLGPHALYDGPGKFSRAGGGLARIEWATGHSGPASAREFRARAGDSSRSSGVLPGTVSSVFAERYAQLYREVENAEQRGELTLRRARILRVRYADDPAGEKPEAQVERSRGLLVWYEGQLEPRPVRRLLLATGYASDTASLLSAYPGFVPVRARVPEEEEEAVVALQALGHDERPRPVFLTGMVLDHQGILNPATSPLGEWVPKVVALAREHAADARAPALSLPDREPRVLPPAAPPGSERVLGPWPAQPAATWGPVPGLSEEALLTLPFDLALALGTSRFPGQQALHLTVSALPGGRLRVGCPSLGEEGLGLLCAALERHPRLLATLRRLAPRGPLTLEVEMEPSTGECRTGWMGLRQAQGR